MNEYQMTHEALKELQDELDQLKTVGRAEMAEKIKVALSFGDLSENAEYDEAKSEQGKMESRINELEHLIRNAVIIDDEATLKRWYYYPEKSKLVLTPENPAFEPLVYVGEELDSVRCIGLAVSFMSKL